MTDEDGMDAETAFVIADKVVEMCERVTTAEKFAPGAVARWRMSLDGKWFDLTVAVSSEQRADVDK